MRTLGGCITRCLTCLALVAGLVPAASYGQWPPDVCGNAELVVCFPQAELDLQFARTFTGSYRNGEPLNLFTITPSGSGETLEDVGITLRMRLYCDCGSGRTSTLANLPADEVILYASSACAWMHPSSPTDADGWTEFHGTLRGGGCADRLMLFVGGIAAQWIPIGFNSPDTALASPGAVDAGDLSALAARLGIPANYSICSDFNEDGAVDAADLSAFAAVLGSACNP